MTPFEVYKSYLSLKNHFTKDKYDYHLYYGKSKASLQSFYKRKDRFYFEKLSRQKNDEEIVDFFVSNFVSCNDPESLWIGEIIKDGEKNHKEWKKKIESLTYFFKNEISTSFSSENFNDMFVIQKGKHPLLLKTYLQNKISLETLVILEKILYFKSEFDKKMDDPVWKFISMRIKKYSPFLNTDIKKFKTILKEIILGET